MTHGPLKSTVLPDKNSCNFVDVDECNPGKGKKDPCQKMNEISKFKKYKCKNVNYEKDYLFPCLINKKTCVENHCYECVEIDQNECKMPEYQPVKGLDCIDQAGKAPRYACDKDACSEGEVCVVGNGGKTNDYECKDIDECALDSPTHSCPEGTFCQNVIVGWLRFRPNILGILHMNGQNIQ